MSVAGWLQASPWAYPGLEVVHIVGIALLVGNLLALEARVLGAAPALALAPLARLCLTLSVTGFGLVALSGILMFSTRPNELLGNPAFLAKMALIAAAGCNAALFHGRRSIARPDAVAKALLVVSGLLWLAAIACGRWIAYV